MSTMPAATLSSLEARWTAVLNRDPQARFVYSVASTGIYCRPACPARRPARKNVAFHETPLRAELAGFRPCKRCKPREEPALAAVRSVVAMCQWLERSDAPPKLEALAAHVGLSPSYAHRSFVKATGLTPKAYREACLKRRVHAELRAQKSVTSALYAAGFGSSARFYDHAAKTLGMSPSQFRKGANGVLIRFALGECSLGAILVAATRRGVCAVFLGDEPEALLKDLKERFPRAVLETADRRFDALVAQVIDLVEARPPKTARALPLDLQGTLFQERVWRALRAIPAGETTTYAALAKSLGMPKGGRAVARACARNPVAVAVPCHRVVRSDGALAGYRWGVERKRELLRRERR